MKTPSFSDFLFVSAALLNGAAEDVTAGVEDITATLFTPGLVNASGITFSESGLNVNVTFASTSRMLIGNGILCGGYGTTNGVINGTYTVNMASLVPVTGSVTAYIVGTAGQIGQQPQLITGPSPGHPDYDPTFVPSTQYLENLDTIYLTPTLTVPDNYTYIEICRVTLTAGQVTIPSVNTTHQYIANVIPEFDGNGSISGNWTVNGTLTANVGGALSGSLPNPGVGAIPGRFINNQIFSTPGTFTYTPTSGMSHALVYVVGGGGSTAGLPACNSSQYAFSPGASSGSMAVGYYTAAQIGASLTITVGAGGGAGTSGGGSGSSGGASSFGSLASAPGGQGTVSFGPASFALIAAGPALPGAVATGGNILNMAGIPGAMSMGGTTLSASASVSAIGGAGGASPLGASGPGAGGGGTAIENGSAVAGNAGGNGIVIVWEYS